VCGSANSSARVDDEEFLEMIASIQGSRMDDQRADATSLFPGLHSSPAVMRQLATATASGAAHAGSAAESTILDDEQFFETLMRCQVVTRALAFSSIPDWRSLCPVKNRGGVLIRLWEDRIG